MPRSIHSQIMVLNAILDARIGPNSNIEIDEKFVLNSGPSSSPTIHISKGAKFTNKKNVFTFEHDIDIRSMLFIPTSNNHSLLIVEEFDGIKHIFAFSGNTNSNSSHDSVKNGFRKEVSGIFTDTTVNSNNKTSVREGDTEAADSVQPVHFGTFGDANMFGRTTSLVTTSESAHNITSDITKLELIDGKNVMLILIGDFVVRMFAIQPNIVFGFHITDNDTNIVVTDGSEFKIAQGAKIYNNVFDTESKGLSSFMGSKYYTYAVPKDGKEIITTNPTEVWQIKSYISDTSASEILVTNPIEEDILGKTSLVVDID